MPIHDLGYRRWDEERTSANLRWQVMAEVGIRQAWAITAVRRAVFLALTPALFALSALFWIEQGFSNTMARDGFLRMIAEWPQSGDAMKEMVEGGTSRHSLWAFVLMIFLRYPQGICMLVLIGIIGPPLISRDVRSRAFLLYFSRPISRVQYVIGKGAILATYLLLITAIPATMIYAFGLLLSPKFVLLDTWDIPFRIFFSSLVLIIPSTSLMLCLSSLTTESRNAGFAWYVIWVLGGIAYRSLSVLDVTVNSYDFTTHYSSWTLISPYHMMGRVQSYVFGLAPLDGQQVLPSMIVLTLFTAFCLTVLFRRVSAPMRI